MSREFKGNSAQVFRVVVEISPAAMTGAKWTSIYGPFAKIGAARSCITRESPSWGYNGRTFTTRIEVALTTWQVTP